MNPELLQALQQLPLETMGVGMIGGAAGGWAWQHFHGVAQFGKDESGMFMQVRPSLRAEKTLNAIQGALAGIAVGLVADVFWEGSWESAIGTTVGIALPFLIKAALDTDRLPPGVKRRK